MKIFRKFAVVLLAATAVGLFAGCANPVNPPKKIDFPEKDEWTSINTDEAKEAFLKGAKGCQYKATKPMLEAAGIKTYYAMKVSDDGTKFSQGNIMDLSGVAGIKVTWNIVKGNYTNYEVLDDSKHTLISDSDHWTDYTILLTIHGCWRNQNYTRMKYVQTSDEYILEKF